MSKIVVFPQVEEFVRSLAPEPRKRLTRALKSLPEGEIKDLEGSLGGYHRIRIGGYRVIFKDASKKGVRTFDCIYAERRAVVYELFEQILSEQALD